ncbi:KTSC domain-containing protein [Pelagicoccus sp. SDUM812002]|uniref:KTSC domain-containing protein n=1 Tax=Pelagicoccus sp. SDUM812002 TaxID=3041266 RepID=UPI0031F2F16A
MEMIPVRSSATRAIGYNPSTGQMQIQFKQGKTYMFCGVPQHVFDSFLSAGSKGSYYDNHIRDRYQC